MTVESPESRSDHHDDEVELKAKASTFAGLDRDSLRDLISKASSDLKGDPAFYSMLVENLLARLVLRRHYVISSGIVTYQYTQNFIPDQ